MVGGCLSCFFTYISVLLLWVCLHDVEASSCEHNIHKKVGDTVELPSCLPAEGVTMAQWKYGRFKIIEDKHFDVPEQFKGRLDLNPTSFNLTVRGLTVQDSGNFSFISEVNDEQRPTVTITLQVHEPITEEPTVTSNSTWNPDNKSCTFLLECRASTASRVTYSWAVRNQTTSGSRLRYSITPQDADIVFTCTISNFVSEKSTIETVTCRNGTSDKTGLNFPVILGAAGGGCLMIVVIVGVAVYVCRCKQSQEAGSNSNDLTVYEDIAEVAIEAGTSSTMKPCTLYETIDKKVDTVTPGTQTVYDQIQFSRMRKASVSPYQEVS